MQLTEINWNKFCGSRTVFGAHLDFFQLTYYRSTQSMPQTAVLWIRNDLVILGILTLLSENVWNQRRTEELYSFSCLKGLIGIYNKLAKCWTSRRKTDCKNFLKRIKYCTLIVMYITVQCLANQALQFQGQDTDPIADPVIRTSD